MQHPLAQRTISKIIFLAAVSTTVLTFGATVRAADPPAEQSPAQDAKDSAHSAKKAAANTGHNIKHGVKKGVHKGAAKVDEGAKKVEGKTPSE